MKCEKCKELLNPYLLRQMSVLDGMDVYEVECPKCTFKNVLTRERYLSLKQDWVMPKVKPINNKQPSEMNVIFLSMPRCGISWVIRALDQYHYPMFNAHITFTKDNAEISKQYAKKNRFPLPKGWNNVYDISPVELLNKKDPQGLQYDRIVVIQRELETLIKVSKLYWGGEGLHEDHINKLLKKSKELYPIVYEGVKDPRLLKISLEDLNEYPTSVLNELMDFLNFPKVGRPPVVDFKPHWFERNWEAVSSIYEKGFELNRGGRLHKIRSRFKVMKDGFLELLSENDEREVTLEKVLVCGPGFHKGCHFSENIYHAFKEKGLEVRFLDLHDLGYASLKGKKYKERNALYSLSKALKKIGFTPDLVVFDEPAFYFDIDVDIPVFYYHREYKRNPTVFYPKIAYFWTSETLLDFITVRGHPYWASRIDDIKVLPPSFNPDHFAIDQEKSIKGISCLAGRERMKGLIELREQRASMYLNRSMREIRIFKEMGGNWIESDDGGLSDEMYRHLLPKSECQWVHLPIGQFISRRLFECAYCKTVILVKVESEKDERMLEEIGYYANEHYIKIERLEEIKELVKTFNYEDYEEMVDKAHQLVLERHLFSNRADVIIKDFKKYMKNKTLVVSQ